MACRVIRACEIKAGIASCGDVGFRAVKRAGLEANMLWLCALCVLCAYGCAWIDYFLHKLLNNKATVLD